MDINTFSELTGPLSRREFDCLARPRRVGDFLPPEAGAADSMSSVGFTFLCGVRSVGFGREALEELSKIESSVG